LRRKRSSAPQCIRSEKGDEVSWLAEALTTHGIALARLKHSEQARAALERAVNISEHAGGFESAGVSALIIVEQIGRNLSTRELCETIDRAGTLLEKTQDINILRRLAKAVFESLFLAHAVPAPPDWKGFSFGMRCIGTRATLSAGTQRDWRQGDGSGSDTRIPTSSKSDHFDCQSAQRVN